ncbi:unnamed protein product, partial [Polarella glacialis]
SEPPSDDFEDADAGDDDVPEKPFGKRPPDGSGPPDASGVPDASNKPASKLFQPEPKVREADSIKVPQLPKSAAQSRIYKTAVRKAVVAASISKRDAFEFMRQVERPTCTFEELATCPSHLENLESKLDSAITNTLTGVLSLKVHAKTEELAKRDIMIAGRQVVWMVYRHFRTEEDRGSMYDLEDLMEVKFANDQTLGAFAELWNNIVANAIEPFDEKILEALLHKQLKGDRSENKPGSKRLSEDLTLYKRMRPSDPNRNYQYLHDAMMNELDHELQETNRKSIHDALNNRSQPLPGAAAELKKQQAAAKVAAAASGKLQPPPGLPGAPGVSVGKQACFAFQRGECKLGKGCKYEHVS